MITISDLSKLNEFAERLGDDESKLVFEARFNFLVNKNMDDFTRQILCIPKKWDLDSFGSYYQRINKIEDKKERKIAIFGAGKVGINNYYLLKKCGYDVVSITDNDKNKWGNIIDETVVISPGEFFDKCKDYIVVMSYGNVNIANQNYSILLSNGFKREYIYWESRTGCRLYANCGVQYFDLMEMDKSEEEIYIDAGCLDGSTSFQFMNWCNNKFSKIYAFEPDRHSYEVCKNNFKNYTDKIKLYNCGLHDCEDELCFSENCIRGASRILEEGENKIKVNSIDNLIKNEKVSFIKMDIEGAELKALLGAEKTIKKYRPKLAISLYHKEEDIIDIPLYLLQLIPDYKFYLRHYSTTREETVLYAI